MQLKPLRNKILFQFFDRIRNKGFVDETAWGFEMKDFQKAKSAVEPRWIKIAATGPDVTTVKVGDFALVKALKWTEEFTHLGESYWQTDPEQFLVTSSIEPTGLR